MKSIHIHDKGNSINVSDLPENVRIALHMHDLLPKEGETLTITGSPSSAQEDLPVATPVTEQAQNVNKQANAILQPGVEKLEEEIQAIYNVVSESTTQYVAEIHGSFNAFTKNLEKFKDARTAQQKRISILDFYESVYEFLAQIALAKDRGTHQEIVGALENYSGESYIRNFENSLRTFFTANGYELRMPKDTLGYDEGTAKFYHSNVHGGEISHNTEVVRPELWSKDENGKDTKFSGPGIVILKP